MGTHRFIVRPETSFILELNGETTRRNEIDGVKVTDSGGTTLFLTPGLQGVIGRTMLLWEVAAQVPIVQELNRDQLRTDFRFLIGVRFLF